MKTAPTLEDLREHRREILELARRHGIEDIRVFGSVARGQADPDSDVDLLVRFPEGTSLLDQIGFMQDLEDLLGWKVDVISEPALHWFVRDRVLAEAVRL